LWRWRGRWLVLAQFRRTHTGTVVSDAYPGTDAHSRAATVANVDRSPDGYADHHAQYGSIHAHMRGHDG
jgi:hypothetical protein